MHLVRKYLEHSCCLRLTQHCNESCNFVWDLHSVLKIWFLDLNTHTEVKMCQTMKTEKIVHHYLVHLSTRAEIFWGLFFSIWHMLWKLNLKDQFRKKQLKVEDLLDWYNWKLVTRVFSPSILYSVANNSPNLTLPGIKSLVSATLINIFLKRVYIRIFLWNERGFF